MKETPRHLRPNNPVTHIAFFSGDDPNKPVFSIMHAGTYQNNEVIRITYLNGGEFMDVTIMDMSQILDNPFYFIAQSDLVISNDYGFESTYRPCRLEIPYRIESHNTYRETAVESKYRAFGLRM